MKCSYCTNEAVTGGEAPPGTGGLRYLLACEKHEHRIASLKFTPREISEISRTLKREEKEAKK